MSKGILFLSIMDFTDSGIQVVKLTPEYFAKKGWNVHYAVTRDNSEAGSYHYQAVVNAKGVNVHRTTMPSCKLGESLKIQVFKTIYSKLRGYVAILKLVKLGADVLSKNKIEVVYGGGPHGVLAAKLIKVINFNRKIYTVSRYYGVWDLYSKTMAENRWFKMLLNIDILASLYLKADLKIITNDGTQGDKALQSINSKELNVLKFWVNGTDKPILIDEDINDLKKYLCIEGSFVVVCVTRLVSIKRIDRCIQVAATAVHKNGMKNLKLIIVGDGVERARLEKMVSDLAIEGNVIFVGAINNCQVRSYLAVANVFLSMYDVSNVGNPLLEAVRANNIIFTLNNGDTSAWIKHGFNGFIYDVNDVMIEKMAEDIFELAQNFARQEFIKNNLKITESEMLWTWDERLQAEFSEIEKMVEVYT